MKIVLMILFLSVLNINLKAQKIARVGVEISGYDGDFVDFEFVNDAANNMTFPYEKNKMIDYIVELKEPSLLKINSWVWMVICPGDDIEVDITYQGRVYEHAKFKGTPSAVALNSAISDGSLIRLKDRYRLNPLAAVMTKVTTNDYHEATLRNWKKEKELLEAIRFQVNPEAYNYIYAEMEGIYMSNLVDFPFMAAAIRHQNFKDVEPKGFWTVMEGYQIKEDKFSLRSMSYINWLIEYADFMLKYEDYISGKEIRSVIDIESEYYFLAKFYKGAVRDIVLYNYLTRLIDSGKDKVLVASFVDDYLKNYNRNRAFRKELKK